MEIPINYAQANLRFTGSALPTGAEITLGLNVELYTGTPYEAALVIADAWATQQLDTLQTDEVALTSILVKFGPNATGPSALRAFNVPGTSTDPSVPPNTAMLVRKSTAVGGRTGRGRLYMPGISETVVNQAGVIDSSFVTNAQGFWDDFLTSLQSSNLIPVLLHGPDSPVSAPLPIVALEVDESVATQRRRLRR